MNRDRSGEGGMFDSFADQIVCQVFRMTERTNFHAKTAIGADDTPVIKAGFDVKRPFFDAANNGFSSFWN